MRLTNHYITLENRSVLSISGSDARDFLQRLITNNVTKLDNNAVIYALMLTPQGKFLYDFFIMKHEEGFLLDVYKPLQEEILKQFLLYKLRSNVTIASAPDYHVYAIFSENFSAAKDPRHTQMGKRGLLNNKTLLATLSEAPVTEYHLLRYQLALPEGHNDLISGESYPHDFPMDVWHAIDYKKGCYVGQEVTSRMHHKTTPKKAVYRIEAAIGKDLPAPETPVTLPSGQSIGIMCSSIHHVGLALLKKEYITQSNISIVAGTVNAAIRG